MITCLVSFTLSYTIAIAGASGGLGRELVYQSLNNDLDVIGITRSSKTVTYPYREGGLEETFGRMEIISDPNLSVLQVSDLSGKEEYDSLVICMSGKPFEMDASHKTCQTLCETLPESCKNICLVSAWGVGDSIKHANPGIVAMKNWYLKSVYESKQIQEEVVTKKSTEKNLPCLVLRPKVLSYGNTIVPSTPREKLASEILEWCLI